MLLDQIKQPNDIKKISPRDYPALAAEIREFLVEWEDVMKAYRYIAASQEEGTMEETGRKEERV